VVVDADVLYGATTRGLLAWLDHRDLIRMHWSPLLIVEMSRALVKTGRSSHDEARQNEDAMHGAVPGASVPTRDVHASFRAAWPGVNDAKDLHVAACAVALLARGYYPSLDKVHLITRNTKDFAPKKLMALGVVQRHPDAFLLELWERDPAAVADAFLQFRSDLPSQPTADALLDRLQRDGQKRTASAMRVALREGRCSL
jgi:hypothetical protein